MEYNDTMYNIGFPCVEMEDWQTLNFLMYLYLCILMVIPQAS
jgi:hypothetical protein